MSSDRWHYLGPYTRTNKQVKDVMENVWGCPKCKTQRYERKMKFCPECGAAHSDFQKAARRGIDPYAVQEEMRDALRTVVCDGLMNHPEELWIPNSRFPGERDQFSDAETLIQPISTETITHEIERFKERFAKERAILKRVYGSIKTEWGLLVWWH